MELSLTGLDPSTDALISLTHGASSSSFAGPAPSVSDALFRFWSDFGGRGAAAEASTSMASWSHFCRWAQEPTRKEAAVDARVSLLSRAPEDACSEPCGAVWWVK